MFSRIFLICTLLILLCLGRVVPAPAAESAAAPVDKTELRNALRELLRQEPELVLDVLRDNGEVVLEAAQQGSVARRKKAALAQWEQDAKTPKKVSADTSAQRGSAKAPVTIVVYSDFTCPYCRQADAVLEDLYPAYKDKVRIIFKPLPKGEVPLSLSAAKYSLAAFMQDKDKGWSYYRALFAGVDDLERDGDTFLKAAAVREGLDMKRLAADVAGPKVKAQLEADSAEADTLNVPGTPYFLVNDMVIRGYVPKEIFELAIDTALKQKGVQ